VFGRLESTHFYERHVSIGRYIPSHLATITNGVLTSPSGTMKLTSGLNQRYKRAQKSPLNATALPEPLQGGCSLVHGRLKTSKMAKIVISTPSPPGLKQIFKETNYVGVSARSF